MAIVKGIGKALVLGASGDIGIPNGCGFAQCGWTRCGEWFPPGGVYKRDGRWKTQRIIKTTHYWPSNPQTVPQQAGRAKFSAGVVHWQSLSDAQKKPYNFRASKIGMSGFNLHQREWMHA